MGMHHNQDIRWMGNVRKYMPITWITSLIGSLALIGTPLFAGFYSKDSIIEAVAESHLYGSGFAYFSVLAGVFVTAFYSFRLYFLVFHGKERYALNPDAHHDDHADAHADSHAKPQAKTKSAKSSKHAKHDDHGHAAAKPHESPWVVTLPLILLAIPSVVIGYIAIDAMLYSDFFKGAIFVDAERHPVMEELAQAFHGPAQMALHGLSTAPFWLALAGVVSAWYMYLINPAVPAAIKRTFMPIYVLLENKYYLDWFNENVLSRGTRMLGQTLWQVGDVKLIDGIVVNGSWKLVAKISSWVRRIQTGFIYHYAFGMIIGVFVLMTYFVWLNR
jgi:NADH-quinone oxidoreductase subunit L